MDYQRVEHVIDIPTLRKKKVTAVGYGGFAGLARHLLRCGVERFRLIDKDVVGEENLCRQDHLPEHLGWFKTDAGAADLKRINPDVDVETVNRDFCGFREEDFEAQLGDTDLFVFATDSHAAQAHGNKACLTLGVPGVWIGLYPNGAAGELFWWRKHMPCCYRCTLSNRYAAQDLRPLDPPSQGADILATTTIDSLGGMLCLGLLTAGADNRYGRLIRQLGDRQFLQVKIDPDWNWNGRDLFREQLQIPADNDAYFSFCAIARRDPDPGGLCPDCVRYRRLEPRPEPSKV